MNEMIISEMAKAFNREAGEVLSMISSSRSLDELHQNVSRAYGVLSCFANMVDAMNKATGYSVPEENMDAARTAYRNALDDINAAQTVWMNGNAPWSKQAG